MASYDPQQHNGKEDKSIFGVIIHSFFVVPFLIAVFSVLLFASVKILMMEKQTVYDLLNDVQAGGMTKRWQSAFELSKVLGNPKLIPDDDKFDQELVKAFNQAQYDDNRVRQYLALAMAKTGKDVFFDPLIKALKLGEKEENLYAIIYALGMLKAKKAIPVIANYLEHQEARIRLVAVMALGNMEDLQTVNMLKKTLTDSEPNVEWDSAVALAKMGDLSGKPILLNLLDRNYLAKFPEVDVQEQTEIILVSLKSCAHLSDGDIKAEIKKLAQSDQNMNVRKVAMEILHP